MAINEAHSSDIAGAEGDMSVWITSGRASFAYSQKPEHIRMHDSCSQSHTLVLLIVRSFAVSLYCSPVELFAMQMQT